MLHTNTNNEMSLISDPESALGMLWTVVQETVSSQVTKLAAAKVTGAKITTQYQAFVDYVESFVDYVDESTTDSHNQQKIDDLFDDDQSVDGDLPQDADLPAVNEDTIESDKIRTMLLAHMYGKDKELWDKIRGLGLENVAMVTTLKNPTTSWYNMTGYGACLATRAENLIGHMIIDNEVSAQISALQDGNRSGKRYTIFYNADEMMTRTLNQSSISTYTFRHCLQMFRKCLDMKHIHMVLFDVEKDIELLTWEEDTLFVKRYPFLGLEAKRYNGFNKNRTKTLQKKLEGLMSEVDDEKNTYVDVLKKITLLAIERATEIYAKVKSTQPVKQVTGNSKRSNTKDTKRNIKARERKRAKMEAEEEVKTEEDEQAKVIQQEEYEARKIAEQKRLSKEGSKQGNKRQKITEKETCKREDKIKDAADLAKQNKAKKEQEKAEHKRRSDNWKCIHNIKKCNPKNPCGFKDCAKKNK